MSEPREIKFRAWDKQAVSEDGDQQMFGWPDLEQFRMYDLMHPDDFVFMQYTGRKDKDGKEIYEGDILRKYHPFTEKPDPNLAVVRYNADTARFNGIPLTYSCEVIGNIYENKELLK